jgi:hypothetical protein
MCIYIIFENCESFLVYFLSNIVLDFRILLIGKCLHKLVLNGYKKIITKKNDFLNKILFIKKKFKLFYVF